MEKRPSLHFGVVAIEKSAFSSSSTEVANFTFYLHLNLLDFELDLTNPQYCPRLSEVYREHLGF